MALRTPPSWLQNGSHSAENDRLTNQAIWKSTGIVNPSDLQITQNGTPNMTVNIGSGWAAIVGNYQSNMGVYMAYNDATVNATITTANASNPRIDLVCLTVSDAYYTGSTNTVAVNIVAGTPASSPTVPSTPTNSIALGQVYVGAGVTSILTANITNYNVLASSIVPANVAGKNKIINGDFNIWQRGISFSNPTGGTYVADRWYVAYQNAAPTTSSVSQQPFTAGSAPVAGYESAYYLRCAFTTIGSNTIWRLDQKIEDVRTFAGQTVTLSFWARSNNSTGLSIFAVQNTGTGGSGGGAPSVVTTISSASWTRYSLTIPIPSLSGATIGTGSNLEIMFQLNSLASGTNFDLWGVQVEAGSVATPFTTASGTLQGELALCQRYYFRINPGSSSSYLVCGESPSTTQWRGVVTFPVAMRSGPTLDGTVSSTYFTVYQKFGGNGSAGPTLIDSNVSSAYLYANSGTAGLVAGNAAHLGAASTSAYLAFIAEL